MDVPPEVRQYSAPNVNSNNTTTTSPTTSSHVSSKKRRASTSTSRGVANLTPEQLAKKRANDREAQRAIRERTKGQIEALERRIQELTAQQPYQELQLVIQQKELVEAENEEIKKRLSSVLSILQPLLGGDGLIEPIPPPCRQVAGLPPILTSGSTVTAVASSYHGPPSVRSATSTSSTYAGSPQASRRTPPSMTQPVYTSQPNAFSPVNVLERRQNLPSHSLQSHPSDEKLDLGYLLQNRQPEGRDGRPLYANERTPPLPACSTLPMHTLSPFQNGRDGPMLFYSLPVRNTRPTCPLDGLLLDYLAAQRQKALEGVPSKELVGPRYPSVVSLLHPHRSHYSHPLSKMFTDMLGTFPDLSTLPEQVGVLYIMFLIMRWQIFPTQETYDRLPDWVTPRPSQLFTPHPAWVDHLPWPRMRDKMVHVYPNIPFDEFFIPYTTTLSLNWPYEDHDTLLSMDGTDELSINPIFEKHIRDLGNWTLGTAFAKAHPTLAETCKIKPDIAGRRSS